MRHPVYVRSRLAQVDICNSLFRANKKEINEILTNAKFPPRPLSAEEEARITFLKKDNDRLWDQMVRFALIAKICGDNYVVGTQPSYQNANLEKLGDLNATVA